MSIAATTGDAPAVPAARAVPAAERPSAHIFLLLVVVGLGVAGYAAVIFAASLRGYTPSFMFAIRDLLLFVPVFGVFFWLARSQKWRKSVCAP